MSDLPEGWAEAALAELVEPTALIQYGILQPGPHIENGVPYVRPTEIIQDEIAVHALRKTSPQIAQSYLRSSLLPGDVILSIVGTIGKVAVVPAALLGANITQSSARIRPRTDVVDSKYIAWLLRSPVARRLFDEAELGTGVPRLNIGDIRQMRLPLSPLVEQRRIVEAVEALLGEVDRAKARLDRVAQILKRFRQAVLVAACTGQLTEEWRLKNPTIAPRFTSAPSQEAEGFDLPESWRWVVTADLCDRARALTYGVIKLGAPMVEGVPTLRSSDVRWLFIDESGVKRIAPEIAAQYGRTVLRGGEVLVTVRGTLGGVASVPTHMAGYNVSREVAVLPLLSQWNADYVTFAVGSHSAQNWLQERAKGAAYTGVNIEDLRKLPLPMPPIAEQTEIVRVVRILLTLADTIEHRLRSAIARAAKLPQAILAKAFAGELVPTEAELARAEGRTYETAEQLLHRIGAAKPGPGGAAPPPHRPRTARARPRSVQ